MKGHRFLTLAVLGLIGSTLPLDAQARAGARGADGARGDRAARTAEPALIVESALRLRERLELTDAQIQALEGIREQARTVAGELRSEMQSVRDDVRGGDVTRNQIQARMEALGERRQEAAAPIRQQLDDVLTAEQQTRLRQAAVRLRSAETQRSRSGRGSVAAGGRGQRRAGIPRATRLPNRTRFEQAAPAGRDRGPANRVTAAARTRRPAVLNRRPGIGRQNAGQRRGR